MPTQQESDVPKAGRQRDERKAWVPNYDLFSFEVEPGPSAGLRTGSGIKMLHQMQAARTQLGRDGEYDRVDAGAATLQDWRLDSGV